MSNFLSGLNKVRLLLFSIGIGGCVHRPWPLGRNPLLRTYASQEQVFPATPADVFVFSGGRAAEEAVAAACPERLLTNVHYLPLDEHWLTPQAAGGQFATSQGQEQQLPIELHQWHHVSAQQKLFPQCACRFT